MKKLRLLGGSPTRDEPLPPWPSLSEEAASELASLVAHGPWALGQKNSPAGGKYKALFEEGFAALCGTRFALAVSTGTTALDMAVEALGLKPGGLVVAANYGHPATIRRAAQSHRLLLLDVRRDTLCLDPAQLEAALGRDPRCVITTHFAGQPGGVEEIAALCREARVPLIEDASHAHGATVRGRVAGSFGDVGCFSLHATKNLPAGEGGIITLDDEELYRRLWREHDLGRDRGEGPYCFSTLGGNHRMSEVHALLALSGLPRLKDESARCSAAVEELRRRLGDGGPLELLAVEPGVDLHTYHLVVTRYRPERCRGLSRKRFILAMCAEGIPCNSGWPATLAGLPFIRPLAEPHATPEADRSLGETVWFDRGLFLQEEGVGQLVAAVEKIKAQAHALGARG
jgi:dTDP-4-amino-4,6-dideoxygalactose transaminase